MRGKAVYAGQKTETTHVTVNPDGTEETVTKTSQPVFRSGHTVYPNCDEHRARLGVAAHIFKDIWGQPPTADDVRTKLQCMKASVDVTLHPGITEGLSKCTCVAKVIRLFWPKRLGPPKAPGQTAADAEDKAVELLRSSTFLTIQSTTLIELVKVRPLTLTEMKEEMPLVFRMFGRNELQSELRSTLGPVSVISGIQSSERVSDYSTINPCKGKEYSKMQKLTPSTRPGNSNGPAVPFGLLVASAAHHLARAVELIEKRDTDTSLGAQNTTQLVNNMLSYLQYVVSISRVNRPIEIVGLSMDDVVFQVKLPDTTDQFQTVDVPVIVGACVPQLLQGDNVPEEHHDRIWKGKQRKGTAMHVIHDTLPHEASMLSLPHAIALTFRVLADVKPEIMDPRLNAGMLMFNTFGKLKKADKHERGTVKKTDKRTATKRTATKRTATKRTATKRTADEEDEEDEEEEAEDEEQEAKADANGASSSGIRHVQ